MTRWSENADLVDIRS